MAHRIAHALYVIAIGCLFVYPACAQQAIEKKSETQRQYRLGDINVDHTRVYTHVFKKTRLGHEHGIEGRVKSGFIQLAQGTGSITFDMRSFVADTRAARKYIGLAGDTDAPTQKKVQANMMGREVLNVGQYPTATFTIETIKPVAVTGSNSKPAYELIGTLELHGAKRPLAVLANAQEKNGWTNLRGRFHINQTEFGIKPFTKALGVIGIANRLTIHGDIWVAGTASQFAQRTGIRR